MENSLNLQEIEKKSYMTFLQDGLWELFIGLTFIAMAFGVVYNYTTLVAVIPCLGIILVPGLKKYVVQPRLGYVKFSLSRETKEKKNKHRLIIIFSITAMLGVVTLLGYFGESFWQQWIKSLALIPFGFVLALVSLVLGILYEIKRCYVYSILIMVTFIVFHFMNLRPNYHFFVLGIILTGIGLYLLVQFLSKYPKPAKENSNVI